MAKKKKDDDAEDGGGDNKKKIIGGVVAAALVYQFVLSGGDAPAEEPVVDEGVARIAEEGEVLSVPELIINLADEDELRYLRVGVAVILELGVAPADVEAKLPIVNDVVVDLMSGKTLVELRKPGAKQDAKDELSEAVRAAFDDELIVRVIFTSFVMQ